MTFGINHTKKGIRIIDISPVLLNDKTWYCIGFEPEGTDMGDFFHMCFLKSTHIKGSPRDLVKAITFKKDLIPLVRIHSECILGDIFNSTLCDCGEQLIHSLQRIEGADSGLLIYLRQEGRGIGMRAKLACLARQEGYCNGKFIGNRLSPDEANRALGYSIDEREYHIVGKFLSALNIHEIELITGNHEKVESLQKAQITIHKIYDIPRSLRKMNNRKLIELEEKLNRNYSYPKLSKMLRLEK